MDCMVSVIVPTYNHEKYIIQALNSILSQKISFSMEILIGDDCSKDRTPEILKKYKTQYPNLIKLFLQTKNVGATRNAYDLLTAAQGKYLATLEGDDYWIDNNKLQQQVDFLENHKEYIGCTHAFSIVDEFGNPLKNQSLSWVKQKKVFTLKDFDGILMPGQPSTFVRRNIFREPKYDYSIVYKAHPMIGDRTLMMIFLNQGAFYCFDDTMSCYRCPQNKNAKNITTRLYKKNNIQILDDFKQSCILEAYARDELGISISLEKRKRVFFLNAIISYFKQPSNLTKTIIIYIYKNLSFPLLAILLLPVSFIKKVLEYIKFQL